MPKIITGHTGTPHITADDVGALLKAVIGSNDYLLSDTPSAFVATLLENNVVQMPNAEVVMQGTHIRIKDTDTVTIAQGQTGMKRYDLIVCRYTKDGNGIEDAEIDIVKGTPAASDPVVPTVTQGDIRGGALLHEMPLFRVELDGYSVETIKAVCNTLASLKAEVAALSGLIGDVAQSDVQGRSALNQSLDNLAQNNTADHNAIKANNLLWSGGFYMTANHQITIPSVQNQTNGIVLIFSVYSSGASQDWGFHSFFVPKRAVALKGGCGWCFPLIEGLFTNAANKYIYITNTKISGNDNNNKSGTGSCGVKYNNARFVLRYVIGV